MNSKPKKMQRMALWIGLPALVVLVVVAVAMNRKKEPSVFTGKVERGDVVSIVTATGTINAVTSVLVGSQVSGQIDKLFADFNSKVTRGQKIAQIEPSLFQARYDQANADLQNAQANMRSLEVQVEVQKADIAAAKANVDKARAAAVQATLDFNRTADLVKQGIVAASQLDSAQANADSAKASLAATQAQYEQSQARLKFQISQVEQAKAQVAQRAAAVRGSKVDLDHTVILAPINGTVVARNVDVGQTVAASLSAPTIFTIAEDLSKMLVYVKTDESDVGNVRVGGMATFRVDAFPRDTFRGRIKEVRINPQTVQNVVTYDTVIEFDNPDEKLLPGMTAYVTIPVSTARDVLKVPNAALRFRPDMSEEDRRAALQKAGIEMPGTRGMAGSGERKGGEKKADDKAPAKADEKAVAGAEGAAKKGGDPAARRERRERGGGGGSGGPADESGAPVMRPRATATDVQLVWVQSADKDAMRPVQVRTGITDYSFTAIIAVLKGELKEGDSVITGMAIPTRATTGQFGPGMGGRPGGGPGGMPKGR